MAIIIAIFFVCPPFHPALTPIGMKLFGIFIASCYGWTTVGLFWPTIFCFVLLPFTGICKMSELLVAGVGNNVFFYLIFIFMLSELISESGLADFIAKWMISRKALQGKPWLIVLLFMLAGFFKTSPFGLLQSKIDNIGVIVLTMLPLLFIKVDGERVWNVRRTFAQVSPDILVVCAFILPLGTYMAKAETGISVMFLSIVKPFLGGLSPAMLAAVICLVTLVLTQFMTNMVVAYMFFPVIIGLSQTMGFNAIPQALLAIYICHVAILIPAACSYAAMTHAHDWVESKSVTKYGLSFVIAGILACVFGYIWTGIII